MRGARRAAADSGFFSHGDDLFGANTSAEVIERLRLDYPNSPFSSGAGYVTVETRMTQSIRDGTGVPVSSGYAPHASNGYITSEPYPWHGNGWTGSRDGFLIPEWSVPQRQWLLATRWGHLSR